MCNTVDIRNNPPFQDYIPSWYKNGQDYIPSWYFKNVQAMERTQGVKVSKGGGDFKREDSVDSISAVL